MERLNVSYNTIKKYSRLLQDNRLSELFLDKAYRPKSEMDDYRKEIMDELDKKTARILREAAIIIEQVTGKKLSKKNGYKPLKVGLVPSKADREAD